MTGARKKAPIHSEKSTFPGTLHGRTALKFRIAESLGLVFLPVTS